MRVLLVALFVAMVGVALWAWVAAPSTARFFVRVGNPPGFDGTVSKGTGLVMWIGLGAVAFLGSFFAEGDIEGLAIAGAGLLVFLLLMQIVSVRRMMR